MTDNNSCFYDQIPRVAEGIDIRLTGLSMEEGFLVSRIDGRTSVKDLAVLVCKSKEETAKIVRRLCEVGILQGAQEGELPIELPFDDNDEIDELVDEEVDLSEEDKQRIILMYSTLSTKNYYTLLGLMPQDDARKVKQAFYQRSKEWHPDRFPRGNLGSFEDRISQIYRQIQTAYATLSDPKKKEEYDRAHAPSMSEHTMAQRLETEREREWHAKRITEKQQRRLARNPLRQRMARAKKLFETALDLKLHGDLVEALRTAQGAVALDDRGAYRELLHSLQQQTAQIRITPILRRAYAAESLTNWEDAIALLLDAVKIAPAHGGARLRLAYNMLMADKPPQQINEHAHRALTLLPDEPEAHFVRGLCYEKGDMIKAAARAYQRAIELKPNYNEAKKRLKRLKWGF